MLAHGGQRFVEIAECVETLLPELTGKHLVMNVSAAIPAVLLDAGFEGWCTVEQDCDPAGPTSPVDDAQLQIVTVGAVDCGPYGATAPGAAASSRATKSSVSRRNASWRR